LSNNPQHDALYEGVAFGLLENRTLIEVRGNDRYTFLHNLCTNDIKSLKPGSGCEAFFTNVQGKTLCHVLVFCLEDAIWISTDPQLAEHLLPHLDKYLIREDVQLVDGTTDANTHLVAGPKSAECVEQVFGTLPTDPLQLTTSTVVPNAMVANGPFGFLVFTPHDSNVSELLVEHGVQSIDAETIELARVEAAFPSSGRDITLDNLPQEINRDKQAISFTKGCYLGQETVARIDALGRVNKLLVPLHFAGSDTPEVGTELVLDEKAVGKVTSACWSPKLDCPIALGFVRREAIEKQATLSSSVGDALRRREEK